MNGGGNGRRRRRRVAAAAAAGNENVVNVGQRVVVTVADRLVDSLANTATVDRMHKSRYRRRHIQWNAVRRKYSHKTAVPCPTWMEIGWAARLLFRKKKQTNINLNYNVSMTCTHQLLRQLKKKTTTTIGKETRESGAGEQCNNESVCVCVCVCASVQFGRGLREGGVSWRVKSRVSSSALDYVTSRNNVKPDASEATTTTTTKTFRFMHQLMVGCLRVCCRLPARSVNGVLISAKYSTIVPVKIGEGFKELHLVRTWAAAKNTDGRADHDQRERISPLAFSFSSTVGPREHNFCI